ncbi:MAG: sugar phosphate isomerase/epimerase family protein [Chloroflexota bacterium]
MSKLACADFTFPLLSHDHSLNLISMLGFEGVDIGLFEERSHLWPSREFANVAVSARELKQKVSDYGLQVADLFLQTAEDFEPYAINHPDKSRREKARDWFQRTIEYATECDCHHITILPGVHFEDETYEASLARCQEELAWRVDLAQQANIVFAVEAHVGSIVPEPEAAAALIKQVPGLTLTLDYTHFTRLGMSDSAIEPLVQYASHFHIRGARKDRLQESFSRNTIDYQRVYEAMKATDYSGWIGIEYVWIDWEHCNECDNVSETIRFRDLFLSLVT